MKRITYLLFLSLIIVGCSVEPIETLEEKSVTTDLQMQTDGDECLKLEQDIFVELCSDAITNPTEQGLKAYYRAQVINHSDLPLTGTFDPTPSQLLSQFEEAGGIGTFATNYSVTTENCGVVTILVSVEVKDCTAQEPCSLFEQDNYSRVYTEAEILTLINGDIMNLKPLWLDLLEDDAPKTGHFVDSKIIDLYNYYRAEKRAGNTMIDLTYVYSAVVGDCTDSTSLTLTVCLQDCELEEPCNPIAQDSYSATYTQAEILSMIDGDILNLKNVFLSLMEDGAPKNEEVFIDSELVDLYHYYLQEREEGATTIPLVYTYNVNNGDCMDSAILTLNITEVTQDTPADPCDLLKKDQYLETYTQEEILSLIGGDVHGLIPLYLAMVEEGARDERVFRTSELLKLYNYYLSQRKAGATTINLTYNYMVRKGDCEDSAPLTLRVTNVSK